MENPNTGVGKNNLGTLKDSRYFRYTNYVLIFVMIFVCFTVFCENKNVKNKSRKMIEFEGEETPTRTFFKIIFGLGLIAMSMFLCAPLFIPETWDSNLTIMGGLISTCIGAMFINLLFRHELEQKKE